MSEDVLPHDAAPLTTGLDDARSSGYHGYHGYHGNHATRGNRCAASSSCRIINYLNYRVDNFKSCCCPMFLDDRHVSVTTNQNSFSQGDRSDDGPPPTHLPPRPPSKHANTRMTSNRSHKPLCYQLKAKTISLGSIVLTLTDHISFPPCSNMTVDPHATLFPLMFYGEYIYLYYITTCT